MVNIKKRILIVEDEVLIADELSSIIQELGYSITDLAFDTESAIESLNSNLPDLVVLDIRMHGINQGFEIAEYIKKNYDIPFIFLTSFADEDTVVKASILKPSAYILKPFNLLDIFSTLTIVFGSFKKQKNKIALKIGPDSTLIDINEILWIKSDDNYIELKTKDKRLVVRATLDSFLSQHGLLHFIRVHRSYAVNPSQIETLSCNQITINGVEIPVSKKYIKTLKAILHK